MKPIYVTQPLLPPLEEFTPYLEKIWASKQLTNAGPFHEQLEAALAEYLGVRHISLFCNATIALVTALQALRITGEVITTPYSFVATAHSLLWNGISPVFADVDPATFNLDPALIEPAITPRTTAIMPVHVYGTPCDVEGIQKIADTYGLKVIYDAAHSFGTRLAGGGNVFDHGDLSVLSFHATKVFNTLEGGAIVSHDAKMKRRIDHLKNFGFSDEVTVVAPGINGKMNEVQAAFGLLQLRYLGEALERRRAIAAAYRKGLAGIDGIALAAEPDWDHNYGYFPIFVKAPYPLSRDALYAQLKQRGIHGRRYFHPLITDFPMYRGLPSAAPDRLPVARAVAASVICLPIYPALADDEVRAVVEAIRSP
jgi:dTDP-4-amino-4,6-dideoxygalactose transaminase